MKCVAFKDLLLPHTLNCSGSFLPASFTHSLSKPAY